MLANASCSLTFEPTSKVAMVTKRREFCSNNMILSAITSILISQILNVQFGKKIKTHSVIISESHERQLECPRHAPGSSSSSFERSVADSRGTFNSSDRSLSGFNNCTTQSETFVKAYFLMTKADFEDDVKCFPREITRISKIINDYHEFVSV